MNLDEMTVFLSCNHTARVDRRLPLGHEIQCRRCFRISTVTDTPNYVVDCTGSDRRSCPVNRSFGTLENSAVQFAIRHRMRYPHHVTLVRNGQAIVHRFGPVADGNTNPLWEVDDEQPVRKGVVYVSGRGFIDDEPPPF